MRDTTRPSRRAAEALERIRLERDEAWARHMAGAAGTGAASEREAAERAAAEAILADPAAHEWRLVDAALERLRCPDCGAELGSGARGCASCDFADGYRFAAREPDRPGVPPGNEHAIRVSCAVLRAPARYPAWAVRGNERYLPLFAAGQMPTSVERERLARALERGWPGAGEIAERAGSVATFAELLATAEGRRPEPRA